MLAFAEGRRDSAADDGDIDLVLRRSLDGGCTWQPLHVVADAGRDTVGNPAPVIDPSSGDVVLVTCRTIGGATKRQVVAGAVAGSVRRVYVQRSTDGGLTLSVPFRPQPLIEGPVVEGSVLQVRGLTGYEPLLYSGPSDAMERLRMQVRASGDGGRSWRPVWTVSPERAGYSDLVQTGAGTIGLLYETGQRTSHDTIRFTRLPRVWRLVP
ncbi:glycoside hydrolase [Streptomyces scopuliridis]|uniref:Glycoside hydrolase n=1 Tax=Streptomyces scopuliridis TaxID=452529 RepID=A0ACD4ZYM6_9ACTN|nr:sialidase family protein [Streptomyces scopuliridis]WSC02952.1 glycoside hydrolase [Streptomyces scopuliridis]WSC11173.1 glycoside hydrolase [Streptomyces scopuliridis]